MADNMSYKLILGRETPPALFDQCLMKLIQDLVQSRISLPWEIKRRALATREWRGANFPAMAPMRFDFDDI